jgi:hypothetical protein
MPFGPDRLNRLLCPLLTSFLITSGFAQMPATGSRNEVSEKAQQRISKAVAAHPDSVFVFDNDGNIKRSVRLTEKDRDAYSSLERFAQSSERSPVDSCNHPTPVPPPPCVLCGNGEIVCSGAKFTGHGQMK